MSSNSFKITLELPKTIVQGSSVQGLFTLTNTGTEDCSVLTWDTPLEGLISPKCFRVLFNGTEVKYDGRIVLRVPSPSAGDYVLIKAGQTLNAEIDFSEAYHFANPGNYSIQTICTIKVQGAKQPATVVRPTPATFEILPGKVPAKPTEAMRYRKSTPKSDLKTTLGAAMNPTITGGSTTEQAQLLQAWNNAYSFQGRAISALDGDKFDTVFANTFTVPATSANKTLASGYYTSMQSGMSSSAFTLTINSTEGGNVLAYTFLDSTTIWFNQIYFDCPATSGDFSMAAIMVHELSHAVCSIPDCSDAIACSYTLGYFSARVYSEYHLTLPEGTITVRNNIFYGSQTEAIWSPCDPNEVGGWLDGDVLNVVCSFNLNPPITPQPDSNLYAGLCVGACSDQDSAGIAALVSEAQSIYVPTPGQLLGVESGQQITTNSSPASGNIFYNAQSTTGTFPLTPSNRGTLTNYIYKWVMTYNGSNTVVPSGNNVEVVFGYGDPMWSEVDS